MVLPSKRFVKLRFEDLDDRSEQELIVDSRDLLKDQAKEAMNSMGKIMEQANAARMAVSHWN